MGDRGWRSRQGATLDLPEDPLELIGRQQELELAATALEDARRGRARSLAFVGEPGIGKTALLDAVVARADAFRVVRAAGSPAEHDFPFAGLMALLRPLQGSLADVVPAQREALDAILAGATGPVGRFVASAGTLAVLAAEAERCPLLLVVDDLQWLDEPTRDVLGFALRRLEADAVATVLASRPGGVGELGRTVDLVHEVPPLDAASARAVLAASLQALDPEVGERLLEAVHGNPLALLELPGRLTDEQRAGLEPLPPALVAGELVEEAFAASAATLGEETRLALAVAALLEESAVQALRAALLELGRSPHDLEPAEQAGLLTLSPGRVVFRHPLVRAAVLRAAGDVLRRRAHLALAAALPPGEQRALHLAEAAIGPDPDAAAALQAAAESAPAVSAAALLARAAALAPGAVARARLLAAAAAHALQAGRLESAGGLVEDALALNPPTPVRGAALVVEGGIARLTRPPAEASELLASAAALLTESEPAQATSLLGDAVLASLPAGDPALTLPLAERFLELAAADGSRASDLARLVDGISHVMRGRGGPGEEVLRSLLDADRPGLDLDGLEVRTIAGLWLGDFGRAVEAGRRGVAEARASGRLSPLPRLLLFVGFAEARLGRFPAAYATVSEAADTAEELGQLVILCDAVNALAGLEARLGLHERCREHAEAAIALGERLRLDWFARHATMALALSELAQGRAERVVELLEPIHDAARARGVTDPGEYDLPSLAEARLQLGERELAEAASTEHEALVAQVPRPLEVAHGLRVAALLAPDDEAETLFARALEVDASPFERGRTRLQLGQRLRRAGERRRAREHLRLAEEDFELLGSTWWADVARRELVASGARLRRRDAAGRDELTPQELQVALQVAAGRTNREIAQTLFLSPKTVEFHLTRIYRKLGLHARAELVERFADQVDRAVQRG